MFALRTIVKRVPTLSRCYSRQTMIPASELENFFKLRKQKQVNSDASIIWNMCCEHVLSKNNDDKVWVTKIDPCDYDVQQEVQSLFSKYGYYFKVIENEQGLYYAIVSMR
jgi:hypothetical protein